MNDIFLAVALGGGLAYLAFLATKKLDVPFLPFLVIGAGLIIVGLTSRTYVGLQDGFGYRQWGYAISESWSTGENWEVSDVWPGKGFWPLLIAGFHQIAGPVFFSLIVFNSLLIAFSTVLLQKATLLEFNVKPRLVFIALILSSSSILLNGPGLLREAIFWLGISAAVLGLAYIPRNHYFTAIAFLGGGNFLILAIRPNYGVFVVYLIAFAALVIWLFQKKPSLRKRAIIGLGCALVLALSFPPVSSYLSIDVNAIGDRADSVSRALMKPDVVTAQTPWRSTPDDVTTATGRFVGSTLGAAITRIPATFFGPFWWEVGPEPIWIVVIASTLHYWFLLATSLLLLIKPGNRNPLSLLLFFMSAIIVASFAIAMTNYGIIVRFRVAAELFLVPLAAGNLAYFLSRRENR